MSSPVVSHGRNATPVVEEYSARRTACDRCRGQKLRCERSSTSETISSCRRCLKARAICSTSNSLKPGRPSQALRVSRERQREDQLRHERSRQDYQDSLESQGHVRSDPAIEGASLLSLDLVPPITWDNILAEDFTPMSGDTSSLPQINTSTSAIPNIPSGLDLPNGSNYNGQLELSFDGNCKDGQMDFFTANGPEELGNSWFSPEDQLDPFGGFEELEASLNPKDECLHKLADLHSSLLKDLNLVKPAGECLNAMAKPSISTSQPCGEKENYNFPIGRMLRSSQIFLEILQYFRQSHSSQQTDSTGTDPAESQGAEANSNPRNNPERPSKSPHDMIPPLGAALSSHQSPSNSNNINFSNPSRGFLRSDAPTTFSILSCYVCLIRIYRKVYSRIYEGLTIARARQISLPPLFPGLQLGGFQLESEPNLQIQILVNVGSSMLAKIDEALGLQHEPGDFSRTRRRDGILGDGASANMFQMMMNEEASEGLQNENFEEKAKPLKEIMKDILRFC